jgi:hypothetical protein
MGWSSLARHVIAEPSGEHAGEREKLVKHGQRVKWRLPGRETMF